MVTDAQIARLHAAYDAGTSRIEAHMWAIIRGTLDRIEAERAAITSALARRNGGSSQTFPGIGH